jgi:hypothetical protein
MHNPSVYSGGIELLFLRIRAFSRENENASIAFSREIAVNARKFAPSFFAKKRIFSTIF